MCIERGNRDGVLDGPDGLTFPRPGNNSRLWRPKPRAISVGGRTALADVGVAPERSRVSGRGSGPGSNSDGLFAQ